MKEFRDYLRWEAHHCAGRMVPPKLHRDGNSCVQDPPPTPQTLPYILLYLAVHLHPS